MSLSADGNEPRPHAVGLFAKPPVAGEVKTRLHPPLSLAQAAALYAGFLGDLTAMLNGEEAWDWVLYSTDPARQRATWPSDAPQPRRIAPQRGRDLGARMLQALTELLHGRRGALLIGSDHPTLPAAHIHLAFERLADHDVVLGPSNDGGYYLVGLREPQPELFEAMTWSTPDVLPQTLDRIHRAGRSVFQLPEWYDVDTAEDLARLRGDLATDRGRLGVDDSCPRTRRLLAEMDG